MATVDITKVAQALNLSRQRVHQLVKEEGMPREARGQYDPIKCMMFYIRYLQRAIEKTNLPALDGSDVGERNARVRLLRAHADLREMELSKVRSMMVSTADVNKSFDDLVRWTTARIMAVPSRLAPDLVGQTSSVMVHAKIDAALKDALRLLAKGPHG
jgi:phage terminase Nu1 subunit (DNA packaging protein)